MKKILKIISSFLLVPIAYLLVPSVAYAVCPVCTVAVAAGLGLSRYLGIDDTISGVWIGGLILSSSLWFYSWVSNKYPKLHSTFYILLTTALMYSLVLLPLAWTDVIGHPFNKLWGIDKFILGIAAGSGAFLLGIYADKKVREFKGKQLFNFQKVVFPVALLLISSLILRLITM